MPEKSPIEQYHRLAELELDAAAKAEDREAKKAHLDQAAVYADLAERNGPEIEIASLSRLQPTSTPEIPGRTSRTRRQYRPTTGFD